MALHEVVVSGEAEVAVGVSITECLAEHTRRTRSEVRGWVNVAKRLEWRGEDDAAEVPQHGLDGKGLSRSLHDFEFRVDRRSTAYVGLSGDSPSSSDGQKRAYG